MTQPSGGFVSAILVAAGSSTRMGTDESKLLLPLLGVPLIARTLSSLERAQSIHEIVIVTRPQDLRRMLEIVDQFGFQKVRAVLRGGDTRQQSVALGVAACTQSDYFAIHDGARPLIDPATIDRSVSFAMQNGACVVAVRMKDTVKEVDENGVIVATPDRTRLWSVQTPQVFERDLFLAALAGVQEQGLDFTDDSQLIEQFGSPVCVCEGSYSNIKITTPEDIALAERYLAERGVLGGKL